MTIRHDSPTDTSNKASAHDSLYDVIIIGAGMVGGALACDLAKSGLKIALVEKRLPNPFDPASLPDIRVSSLNPGSEHYLHKLGAWQHIRSMRLQPYRHLAVWEKLTPFLTSLLPAKSNRTEFSAHSGSHTHLGHIIENRVIQLALQQVWQRHSGVTCFENTSIEQLQITEDSANVVLDSGTSLAAKLVVGADGAESRVRQLARLGISCDSYAQHAMVISVTIKSEPSDITWQAFTPHGPLAFLPLPRVGDSTCASLVWYDLPDTHNMLMALPQKELIARIQKEFPAELPPVTNILAKATFPLIKRHANQYQKHRVALIGDAAHTINPLAGQGLNLGLQDARILASTIVEAISLKEDPGDENSLANYEKVRRPANLMMMTAMDGFYYTFSNDIAPLKLLRNLGLGIANQITPAKKQVMAYALGMKG